ncbi:hypothetical protein Fmac_015115 [Flemingia macrophylla]|uniref:Strictosidine synthase conserved region domain-containing protein n=1 Tax=Flemingia macrophylla TaxID=520843 RepID=A0ABD1ME55_9FABA
MSESGRASSNYFSSSPHSNYESPTKRRIRAKPILLTSLFAITLMAALVAIIYGLGPLNRIHRLSRPTRSEVVAVGELVGPEDLAYDKRRRVIYTGCEDGWIKRVTVADSVADTVVENWVNTGGRPLGLALEKSGELMVADGYKGLLRVTREKRVEVLADEVEGLKFKLTDGVDVAEDGTIYFTDATYKYSLDDYYNDIVEGKPHGRFMKYNPKTKKVTVLVRNLFFPNGVVVSSDQRFVIYCETIKKRCRKYYIAGPKKGKIGEFCRNLPGIPDNIHYVGQGQYYVALTTSLTPQWDLLLRYPFIRKVAAMIIKYMGRLQLEENGGVLVVNLEGKPTAHYYDIELSLISSGIKVENYIYCGSLTYPYLVRFDLKKYSIPPFP